MTPGQCSVKGLMLTLPWFDGVSTVAQSCCCLQGALGSCDFDTIFVSKKMQLSGVLIECRPAALKAWVQIPGGETKNFQNWLSSAETQQLVDRMRRKARGYLVLGGLC